MLQAPVKRIQRGAFVADALTGQTVDFETWQFWRWDDGVRAEPTSEGLRVVGTTQEERRAFSGLVSRRLYPPDAVLICEVGVRCEMKQAGRLGAVVHLCNRLVGDDIVTLEIPDNNGGDHVRTFRGPSGLVSVVLRSIQGDVFQVVPGRDTRASSRKRAGFVRARAGLLFRAGTAVACICAEWGRLVWRSANRLR